MHLNPPQKHNPEYLLLHHLSEYNPSLLIRQAFEPLQLTGERLPHQQILIFHLFRLYHPQPLDLLYNYLQNRGQSRFEFVIGGPYGVDDALKQRADLVLSLSPLTMSHQIVRGVLLEQLYRVLDLNAGGRYHK